MLKQARLRRRRIQQCCGREGNLAMSTRKTKLSVEQIAQAFAEGPHAQVPLIISPAQLGQLLGISPKTIYEWIALGRLDGAFRKRGKHILIWRDRALELLFNGPEWNHE